MRLAKLEIERMKYGPSKDQYLGHIKFDDEHGDVTVKLSEDDCYKLFEVIGDAVIATAKEAASNLTCAIIEHKAKGISRD